MTTAPSTKSTTEITTLQQGIATRRPGAATVLAGGSGLTRTGVTVVAAPALTREPAALVQRAVYAVMHPGRALLMIVAITVICALGFLALVTSMGRRPLESG